jgi:RND family efflux transporter MFP subunit
MSRTHLVSLTLSLAFLASCSREGEVARLPAASSTPLAQPAARVEPANKPASNPTTPAENPASPDDKASADTFPAPPPGSAFLSGQTEAHRRSTLTPKVSSTVTRVLVRDGDIVKNGQALVVLDTQDFALRTQQAEAALQAAKVQLDSAKLDWNRAKALLDDKAVPQAQFDMADARLKGAQAGVLQAETAVAIGRKALRDATIHAPFNGIIVKRMVNEGEYASVMPATQLVIVEEVDPLDLRIQVPSTDLNKAKAGDTVKVRFPATGQTLEARLTRVVAAMDPRTRTFAAIAELPNKDHALRSGLYAEVSFVANKAAAVEPPAGKTKPAAKRATRPAPAKKATAVSKD